MRSIAALLIILCASAAALADLKVTRKVGAGGHTSETTIYVKGSRQRTEMPGMTTIQQCDLKRTIHINDGARRYFIVPDQPADGEATPASAPQQGAGAPRRGGVVTQTVTVTETGERKEMFGYTARRVRTRAVVDAPEGTCHPSHVETESDGWYIDLGADFSCEMTRPPAAPAAEGWRPDCQDQFRTKQTGSARLGFPVHVTTRFRGGRATPNADEDEQAAAAGMAGGMTTTLEVTEISDVKLEASLFEIPAGYTEVKSMAELYGASASADDGPAARGKK